MAPTSSRFTGSKPTRSPELAAGLPDAADGASRTAPKCRVPARLVPVQPVVLEERVPATAVARLLGVKTATLAKWRYRGVGPRGWISISATLVAYPVSEVHRFLDERKAKGGDFK
jgi:hypothetical protein